MSIRSKTTETSTSISYEKKYGISFPYEGETPTRGARSLEDFYLLVNTEFAKDLWEKFESKKLKYLAYETGWDGENGREFSESIFNRIDDFLFLFYNEQKEHNIILNIPQLIPVPDGSIDVLWRFRGTLDLMINFLPNKNIIFVSGLIKDDEEGTTTINGTNYKSFTMDGNIESSIGMIVKWLSEVIP